MSSKFNIIMSSANRASGTIPKATYNIDWSSLPDGKFSLSFSFSSAAQTGIPLADSAVLVSI